MQNALTIEIIDLFIISATCTVYNMYLYISILVDTALNLKKLLKSKVNIQMYKSKINP